MAKMYAGIDVGYGQVKIIIGDDLNSRNKILFPYAIKREKVGRIVFPGSLQKTGNITKKYWLNIDGADVQLGENAGSLKNRLEKSISKRDYIDYEVMALGSIAMFLQEKDFASVDLCLTFGAPKSTISLMKTDLTPILSGLHDYKVCWFDDKGENSKNIHINVAKANILEQGFGAFLSLNMKFDENGNIVGVNENFSNSSMAVLDIGTYTTNFIFFANGRYDEGRSESAFEFGTMNIIESLRNKITNLYGIPLPPQIINKAVLMNDSPRIIIGNEDIDVTELKEKLVDATWKDLKKYLRDSIEVAKLQANQLGSKLKVVFTGGGSKLFAKILKNEFNGDMFIYSRDPVFDNALGFFIDGFSSSQE